jgi:hypothetical protein
MAVAFLFTGIAADRWPTILLRIITLTDDSF